MKKRVHILYMFISVFVLGTAVPTIAMFERVVTRVGNGARRMGQVASLGARNRNVFISRRNRSTSQYQTPQRQRRHILTPNSQNGQPTGSQNTPLPRRRRGRQRPSLTQTRDEGRRIRAEFGGGRSVLDFGDEETNGIEFDRGEPLTRKTPDTTPKVHNPDYKKGLLFLNEKQNKMENPILEPEWPLPTERKFIKGTRQPSLTDPNITEETIRLAEKRGQTNRLSRVMDKETRKKLQGKINTFTKYPRERSKIREKINRDLTDRMKTGDNIDPRVIRAITLNNKQSIKRFGELARNLKKGSAKDIKNSLNLLGGNVTVVGFGFANKLCGKAPELKTVFLKNQTGLNVIYNEKTGEIKYIVAANQNGYLLFESNNEQNSPVLGNGMAPNALVSAGSTIKVFALKDESLGEMFRNMQGKNGLSKTFEVVDNIDPKVFAQTLQLDDLQPRELTDGNKQLTQPMMKKGPQQVIDKKFTKKANRVKSIKQQPAGNKKRPIRVYTDGGVTGVNNVATQMAPTKQPEAFEVPNTGIQTQQLSNAIQTKNIEPNRPVVRRTHPMLPRTRKKLFSGVKPKKYVTGHKVSSNKQKKGDKPKSIMNIKVTKKPVKNIKGQFVERVAVKQTKLTEAKEKEVKVVTHTAKVNGQIKLIKVKEKELIKDQAQQVELIAPKPGKVQKNVQQKDNVPMVAEKTENSLIVQPEKKNGLMVQPDDLKNLTVAEKVEKGLTVQQEKKNSLIVQQEKKNSLTVQQEKKNSLIVQQEKKNSLMVQPKKEVTRDKPKPYYPPFPLLMLSSVPQNEQVQVTDSSENDENGVGSGMSQFAFPHYGDKAGKRHKKGPVNEQNDEMAPKKDYSEDNKQGAVPTTTNNTDENDAYEPNKPRSGRVYQSDVSDNSPEGQKAGGLGGANSDVPGKPSQDRRLPFSWLWLILGSIAEALQHRRRRKFLNIFPGA